MAIGTSAGFTNQRAEAVAIGVNAGQTDQGTGSICIGANSGSTFNNSIVINASGITQAGLANACYIRPLRNASVTNSVYYNTSTYELTFSTSRAIDKKISSQLILLQIVKIFIDYNQSNIFINRITHSILV